jgi:hypothetical protein
MGKMKKIAALVLLLSMVFTLCACGAEKVSNVTISDLESKSLKAIDSNARLTKANDGKGISFSWKSKLSGSWPMNITGIANEKEQLSSITATISGIDTDYFMSCTDKQIAADILDWQNVPMNKLACSSFFMKYLDVVSVLSGESGHIDVLLDARSGKSSFAGWEYRITTDKANKSATIVATYVG